MSDPSVCDAVRRTIGRYGGNLSAGRSYDLAVIPVEALISPNAGLNPAGVEDVWVGRINQAGEDGRNVAHIALLLAGFPDTIVASWVNRLYGSGMAGGIESMIKGEQLMPKADTAFSRDARIYDTTIGWSFVNPLMEKMHGVYQMHVTAENVADEYRTSCADQDRMALASQRKALAAQTSDIMAQEIVPLSIASKKEVLADVSLDEHPRSTSEEALARLKPLIRVDVTVTAGNASGVNDGASAMMVASDVAAKARGLTPRARIVANAVAGWYATRYGGRPGSCDAQVVKAPQHFGWPARRDQNQRRICGAGASGTEQAWGRQRCSTR